MKGMLFKGAMALGVIRGYKTKTRRTNGSYNVGAVVYLKENWKPDVIDPDGLGISCVTYQADGQQIPIGNTREAGDKWGAARRPGEQWPELKPVKWRPSIHMPEWAARATIRIVSKLGERVQDISDDDVIAEGCRAVAIFKALQPSNSHPIWSMDPNGDEALLADTPREAFRKYISLINGPQLWERNELVYVYGLKLVTKVTPESRAT